jgi:lipopolysaccharide transport system ATP-binding protein
MAQPIISVEGLSKRYMVGATRRHDLLRDRIAAAFGSAWRGLKGGRTAADRQGNEEEFWALRDVSFEINQGDVVGIVGRNGAGKSTLLKILSRITQPTTGRVTLRGRVASLLEVGTGFHPELTGRENIFLNGAILGMTREEIRRKFDAIVAFAEIGPFLDTPVKRYSSGMYVRLAFAVAAHLEPEILIVDEVLAVGDIAFQKKCLGKMHDVSTEEGRTVLFVSHNLAVVRQICRSAILLERGRLVAYEATPAVIAQYAHGLESTESLKLPKPSAELRARAYVSAVWLESADGAPLTIARVGQPWRVRVRVRAGRSLVKFVAALGLVTSEGIGVQTAWSTPCDLPPGEHEFTFTQNVVTLAADSYKILIGLSENDQSVQQFEAERLEISSEDPLIPVVAASGYGLVLNSMQVTSNRV